MALRETSMTVKGQVTLPAEVRAHLGLKPRDRVRFEIKGDEVVLKPATSRIDRYFGVVSTNGRVLSLREEREAFEEGVAEEVSNEG